MDLLQHRISEEYKRRSAFGSSSLLKLFLKALSKPGDSDAFWLLKAYSGEFRDGFVERALIKPGD